MFWNFWVKLSLLLVSVKGFYLVLINYVEIKSSAIQILVFPSVHFQIREKLVSKNILLEEVRLIIDHLGDGARACRLVSATVYV